MSDTRTFSESWYRVAEQRVSLRAQVKVRRQYYRGEKWYVVYEAFNNQFYRLKPAAYDFVARLRPDKTLEEAWKECLEQNPSEAPGQEDVIQLLSQLYHANLLVGDFPPDSQKLFERYQQRKQRETKGKLLNIMFARFPLWDPDEFLRRTLPVVGKFLGLFGGLIWLAVALSAGKLIIENFSLLWDQTQQVLAPGNLFMLYTALVGLKALHEMGHAYFCRYHGGEVHVMGIMLLVFTPIPYMDATSSWAFRNRWHRMVVGAGGMVVEIFVAALATFVWANTGPGTAHNLAYNVMFIASVSTILFNANPLLRFDGYYILSDLLDIPNLHTRARNLLRHLVERYAFGYKKSFSPTKSAKETFWLTIFGISSMIYRVFVFTAIVLFVADRFLLAGIIMALICVVSWVLVPIFKFVNYLATSPRLERSRARAANVSIATLVTLLLLLYFIPMPYSFRAPGIIQAKNHTILVNNTEGYVVKVLTPTGATVEEGQPLLQLKDDQLDLEIRYTHAQLDQAQSSQLWALHNSAADLKPILSQVDSVLKRLDRLSERKELLTVRASQKGTWSAPDLDDFENLWIRRGTPLGEIVDPSDYEFSIIVPQKEIRNLLANEARNAEIRLNGEAGINIAVGEWRVNADQENLPSLALGYRGGGDVAVDLSDPSGTKVTEPFFEVIAEIGAHNGATLIHGRSGKIRFRLKPVPLLKQWYWAGRQMLQRRYNF